MEKWGSCYIFISVGGFGGSVVGHWMGWLRMMVWWVGNQLGIGIEEEALCDWEGCSVLCSASETAASGCFR